MKPSRWRTILLALAIFLVAQEALTIYLTQTFLDSNGVTVAGSVAPMRWKIAVYRDSAGYRAGLRDGDIVDASLLTPAERFRFFTTGYDVKEPCILPVVRSGRIVRVFVPHVPYVISWELWFAIFAGFWAGGCALVLALRRSENREVQWLVLWLVFMRLSLQMSTTNGPTPYPAFDLVYMTLGALCGIGWAFLAFYSASFLERPSRTVRVLVAVSCAAAVVAAVVSAAGPLMAWFGVGDPGKIVTWFELTWPLAWLAPLTCGFVALSQARGSARERLAWTLFGAAIYAVILLTYNLSYIWPVFDSDIFQVPAGVLQIVSPAILTYAMLNRRLLDIGFAINRAVVFTGVSVVVVGIFIIVEWAFGEWFASATHAENALLSGSLALALGLSIRAIHHRVDRVLDAVFFRKRHEDEQALRTFAKEAPYITDGATLLERTERIITERADASFVRIVIQDGGSTYGGVDENDEALVALRAHRRVLDLHTVRSELTGEFAYPMVARGRLIGAIVLEAKRSGESYAPDESSAIAEIAQSVGAALDVLSRPADGDGPLLAAIRDLQATVGEIVRRMPGAYPNA